MIIRLELVKNIIIITQYQTTETDVIDNIVASDEQANFFLFRNGKQE